jgi:SAM-dependent methyltransferase
VRRWAVRRKRHAQLIGYDLNPRSAPAAKARTDPKLKIEFRTGDVFALTEPVDFVISSLTAHHMTDDELVRFLQWMEASATGGWFINDLHRHWLAYHGFKSLAWLAGFHPFVRHDGPISVARSFRRADWRGLLARAGIDSRFVNIVWRFPFRLCVGRMK